MAEFICFLAGGALGWVLHQYKDKLVRIKEKVEEEFKP